MRTDFKVYQNKIHVFREANELDPPNVKWVYIWSTNAYSTCKEAVEAATIEHPDIKFKAFFSKD